jgi:hypothetical protein
VPVYRAPCTFQNSLITTTKGKTNSWLESFDRKSLLIFNPLESVSDESAPEFRIWT